MLLCRITQLRRSIGLSQLQLAKELHLSPSTIGMYEQGRRTPSIDILIQMAKIFNVSLDYLVTGLEVTPSFDDLSRNSSSHSCPCCKGCYRKIHGAIGESPSASIVSFFTEGV